MLAARCERPRGGQACGACSYDQNFSCVRIRPQLLSPWRSFLADRRSSRGSHRRKQEAFWFACRFSRAFPRPGYAALWRVPARTGSRVRLSCEKHPSWGQVIWMNFLAATSEPLDENAPFPSVLWGRFPRDGKMITAITELAQGRNYRMSTSLDPRGTPEGARSFPWLALWHFRWNRREFPHGKGSVLIGAGREKVDQAIRCDSRFALGIQGRRIRPQADRHFFFGRNRPPLLARVSPPLSVASIIPSSVAMNHMN